MMPDANLLAQALSQLHRAHPQLAGDALSGHCDAFALALHDQLTLAGVPCELHAISRERVSLEDDTVLDENPLSHVVLAAYGQEWDVLGANAFERWEQDWIQPSTNDEPVECEDAFDWSELSPQALVALRLRQDQRAPCEDFRQTVRGLLQLYLDNAHLLQNAPQIEQHRDYYKRGGCHELAVALHRERGYDLCFACTPGDDSDCHVYARDPNNLAWDIAGARPFEAIAHEGRKDVFARPRTQVTVFTDEASFLAQCVDVSQQFERPLSTYTDSEVARAGALAEMLAQHPAFGRLPTMTSKPKPPRR